MAYQTVPETPQAVLGDLWKSTGIQVGPWNSTLSQTFPGTVHDFSVCPLVYHPECSWNHTDGSNGLTPHGVSHSPWTPHRVPDGPWTKKRCSRISLERPRCPRRFWTNVRCPRQSQGHHTGSRRATIYAFIFPLLINTLFSLVYLMASNFQKLIKDSESLHYSIS